MLSEPVNTPSPRRLMLIGVAALAIAGGIVTPFLDILSDRMS